MTSRLASHFRENWIEWTALIVSLGAIALRLLPWDEVFRNGDVVFVGIDSHYHMWRVKMLLDCAPCLPTFDPYISFPAGAPIPWPPGFDLLLAAPGLFSASMDTVKIWAAICMPILGGLGVYLTYRMGALLFGKPTALLAALVLAFMNGFGAYSMLGRTDHHALVAPVMLGVYLTFFKSVRATTIGRRWLWAGLSGLLAAYSMSSWIVTPGMYLLPPLAAIAVTAFYHPRSFARLMPAPLMILVLDGLAILLLSDLNNQAFALYQPSLFHLSALAVCVVGTGLIAWRPKLGLALCILFTLATGLTYYLDPAFIPQFQTISSILTNDDPSYAFVSESKPLFHVLPGMPTLRQAAMEYSYFVLLWPLLLALVWRMEREPHNKGGESKDPPPERLHDPLARRLELTMFMLFALIGLSWTMLQNRFGEYASPALAILIARSLWYAKQAFGKLLRQSESRKRAIFLALGFCTAVGIAFQPMLKKAFTFYLQLAQGSTSQTAHQFSLDFARHSPPPSVANKSPEYGILTNWTLAHRMLWVARRPVIMSSFGTSQALAGNRKASAILFGSDEEFAYEQMTEMRLRYLVVSEVLDEANHMALLAGFTKRALVNNMSPVAGTLKVAFAIVLKPIFIQSIYGRLFVADGSDRHALGHTFSALGHFRLHLEHGESSSLYRVAKIKSFELVAGALLEGQAEPGQTIKLRLGVTSSTGRRFSYERETRADQDGHFKLRVPYSTGNDSNLPTHATSPYRVRIGQQVFHLAVTEDDVQTGRRLHLPEEPVRVLEEETANDPVTPPPEEHKASDDH